MPFNGSGTFVRLYSWVVDAANSVNISSSRTDAEMNGFAAGLTNCITRDGQSPPSADTPWGGKKITNLGAATVSTDALSMASGDTRYILASGATNLTLTGTLTAATLTISGNGTVGGSFGVTGLTSLGNLSLTGDINLASGGVFINGNGRKLQFADASGTNPYLICQNDNKVALYSTDASGVARLVWSVAARSGTSTFDLAIGATAQTPTGGDNSTKIATTAFVAAALGSYALLASPALSGTPTAPTAAAGTATTQLATTAFVDGLRDVPSNAQTVNYTLALTDRGKGVDFNGTSLTCTIPANASVAFPVGAVVVITNLNSTSLSIAITTDTLTLSGTTTTGTRTLGQNGEARLRKVTATSWLIAGTNLS